MGNPAGNDALACELVAGELAQLIGLKVPDFAVVNLDLNISMDGLGSMTCGPAFVSRALTGSTGDDADTFLKKLARPSDIARLVLFDTWIRNADRWPPDEGLQPYANYDNLFFSPKGRKFDLIVLDHSHCFVGGELDDEIMDPDICTDQRIYGLFPCFVPYIDEASVVAAAEAIRAIDRPTVQSVIDSIPNQWGPLMRTKDAWVDVILTRAALVYDTAPEKLLQQGRLGL
jgi:hypothetical protein